jgi:hypothetical protein
MYLSAIAVLSMCDALSALFARDFVQVAMRLPLQTSGSSATLLWRRATASKRCSTTTSSQASRSAVSPRGLLLASGRRGIWLRRIWLRRHHGSCRTTG